MKAKHLLYVTLVLSLGVTFCGDDEDSLDAGDCEAPTIDGAFHEVDAGCRALDEEEHVRLEGVDVPTGESITVRALADSASDTSGYTIVISGDGSVTMSSGGTEIVSVDSLDVTGGVTFCFDLHAEEGPPDHLLFWTGSDCSGEPSEDAALFNSEDAVGLPDWGDPDGLDFFYQVSSGASLDLIETDEPFFEEAE